MNVKIIVATHKNYQMPTDSCYIPIHVGKLGKSGIEYIGDDTGDNISIKNPYYCELTGLYWAWKNLKCDYIGLAHYRRHLSNKNIIHRLQGNKFDYILTSSEVTNLLKKYDVILPKKRNYFIETVYSHYAHTFHGEHLDETKKILEKYFEDYVKDFDVVMNRTSAHMFNMFIMKKDISDRYCEWLFFILSKLEERIDMSQYDAFQARLFGRVSERLLNVWLEHNKIEYKEIPFINMERVNWTNKGISFLKGKFLNKKYEKSF